MIIDCIVPAAGLGERMGQDKVMMLLGRKPILAHTLDVLEKAPFIKRIVLVVSKNNLKKCRENIVAKYRFKKIADIVEGGATRTESVYKGLKAISNSSNIIVIHDGVRPFLTQKILKEVIVAAKIYKAAVAGVKIKPTIKKVTEDLFSNFTLDRRCLWEIQTPQAFRADLIKKAYNKAIKNNIQTTDDASLVERLNFKVNPVRKSKRGQKKKLSNVVKIVESSYLNIKITTQEDLILARGILNANRNRLRHS